MCTAHPLRRPSCIVRQSGRAKSKECACRRGGVSQASALSLQEAPRPTNTGVGRSAQRIAQRVRGMEMPKQTRTIIAESLFGQQESRLSEEQPFLTYSFELDARHIPEKLSHASLQVITTPGHSSCGLSSMTCNSMAASLAQVV